MWTSKRWSKLWWSGRIGGQLFFFISSRLAGAEDANLDGKISEDEMAAALRSLNPQMDFESVKCMFKGADLNKDCEALRSLRPCLGLEWLIAGCG